MAANPICTLPGCGKPHVAFGFCSAHYARFKSHGDPLGGRIVRGTAIKEMDAALGQETDECIFWHRQAKSTILYNGKYYPVSRLACILAHGEPPQPKLDAAHSCGNGHLGCINKRHLRWATRAENSADSVAHGTMIWGDRTYNARINNQTAIAIRERLKQGERNCVVADDFGVSRAVVHRIKANKSWKKVL